MSDTILAFDFGLRNIGVACCQPDSGLATELTPLKARDGIPDWDQIGALISQWQAQRVLVGLPLNMDDSESQLSSRARKFGKRLHGRFGVQVEMVDERLSSFAAKEEASARGHRGNYSHAPIDSIAARLILESWRQSQ